MDIHRREARKADDCYDEERAELKHHAPCCMHETLSNLRIPSFAYVKTPELLPRQAPLVRHPTRNAYCADFYGGGESFLIFYRRVENTCEQVECLVHHGLPC